jgi:integrase
VTKEEFDTLVSNIEDKKIRLLHTVAFATGMRLGEIFAIEPRLYNRRDNTIKVLFQIDKKKKKRKTKNRKDRTTYVLPAYRQAIEEWFSVVNEFDHRTRLRISRYTQKASKLIGKSIRFHDLRHSYAIYLLSRGVPLSHVAQCLGDSISVAEEYYVGFNLSADSINLINSIVKSA